MFTPMPYFDPIQATRDIAEARIGEHTVLQCKGGCKHRVLFMTPDERTRFMVSSNWTRDFAGEQDKGMCPVCRDPRPPRTRKPLLGY